MRSESQLVTSLGCNATLHLLKTAPFLLPGSRQEKINILICDVQLHVVCKAHTRPSLLSSWEPWCLPLSIQSHCQFPSVLVLSLTHPWDHVGLLLLMASVCSCVFCFGVTWNSFYAHIWCVRSFDVVVLFSYGLPAFIVK